VGDIRAATEIAEAAEESVGLVTGRTESFLVPAVEAPAARDDLLPLQVGDRYFNTATQTEFIFKLDGWKSNDSLTELDSYKSAAADAEDPSKGAALCGFDGESVADVLEQYPPLQDYTVLKNYRGRAEGIRMSKPGIAGNFRRDPTVLEADDGITFLDGLGRGWRRVFTAPIRPEWYGADLTGVVDASVAVQKAITAANKMALAIAQRVEVRLSGRLRLSPQYYHGPTNWSHCILVEDNVMVSSDAATIVTSVAFVNRAVIFLARGDNIIFKGLKFYDESPVSSFAVGIGGGSAYDSQIAKNRVYRDTLIRECEAYNLWLTHSFQFGTLDDGTSFWDGITYDRCESYAKPGNTSSGNFNFRSDPPHKILNAKMLFCKARNGATASSFNFVGVDGGSVIECDSRMNLFGACELENGCRDIRVVGLKSRDDAVGLWIDDSTEIDAVGIDMINTIDGLVTPLLGTLPLNRHIVRITRGGYAADPQAETGRIRIRDLKGKNYSFSASTYGTLVGAPWFSSIDLDGFRFDNDGKSSSGRAIFFSNVPNMTLRNGRISGATSEQITGSSSGGHLTIENVRGYTKGNEVPVGLTVSGTSSSNITNSRLQSFAAVPSGVRSESGCFDAGGPRPSVTATSA
jgi:hypothetical protein